MEPSISEIISSTVIDKDYTLVDKTITNSPNVPKSILIAKPKVIQENRWKMKEEKRESKRQRDEKNKK